MRYAKAIVGAVVAGLTSLHGSLDNDTITTREGVAAAIAVLVALGVIWAVPNREA